MVFYVFSVLFAVTAVLLTSGKTSINKTNYVYAAESKKDTRTGVYKAAYATNGKSTTEWCYLKNGKAQYNYTGFASNSNGWWYVKNGKLDQNYQGIGSNNNGDWYCSEGKVIFERSGIEYIRYYNSKEVNKRFLIKNGKVDYGFTGLYEDYTGFILKYNCIEIYLLGSLHL
ncbi:MAG: hypothetical protein IJJ74_00975 [Eubacterium sp.]|nr:hypothetical protein [Eubacterium sp.]